MAALVALRKVDESLEAGLGGAGVDGPGGEGGTFLKIRSASGGDEGSRGIHEHDVAPRAGLPGEDGAGDGGVLFAAGAA